MNRSVETHYPPGTNTPDWLSPALEKLGLTYPNGLASLMTLVCVSPAHLSLLADAMSLSKNPLCIPSSDFICLDTPKKIYYQVIPPHREGMYLDIVFKHDEAWDLIQLIMLRYFDKVGVTPPSSLVQRELRGVQTVAKNSGLFLLVDKCFDHFNTLNRIAEYREVETDILCFMGNLPKEDRFKLNDIFREEITTFFNVYAAVDTLLLLFIHDMTTGILGGALPKIFPDSSEHKLLKALPSSAKWVEYYILKL